MAVNNLYNQYVIPPAGMLSQPQQRFAPPVANTSVQTSRLVYEPVNYRFVPALQQQLFYEPKSYVNNP